MTSKVILLGFFGLLIYLILNLGGVPESTHLPRHALSAILFLAALAARLKNSIAVQPRPDAAFGLVGLSAFGLLTAAKSLFQSTDLSAGVEQLWLLLDGLLIFMTVRWVLSVKNISTWWITSLSGLAALLSLSHLGWQSRLIYNPNHLAALLSMLLFLPLSHWLNSPTLQKGHKQMVLATTLVTWLALLTTLSRAGIFAASVAGILMLHWQGKLKMILRHRRVWLLLLITLGVSIYAWFSHEKTTFASVNTRIELIQASLRLIWQQPILGFGLGSYAQAILQATHADTSFITYQYAHNDYLQLAVELGLNGLTIAVIWIFVLMRWSLKNLDLRPYGCGTLAGVVAVLIHSFFDFSLRIPCNLLLFAALAGSLTVIKYPEFQTNRQVSAKSRMAVGLLTIVAMLANVWLIHTIAPYNKNVLLKSARQQRERGELLIAPIAAEQAYQISPDVSTMAELIALYLASHLPEKAEPLFAKALAIDPKNDLLKELYARHLLTQKSQTEALDFFRQVFAKHPERLSPNLDILLQEVKNPWTLQSIIPLETRAAAVWLGALRRRQLNALVASETRRFAEQFPDCQLSFARDHVEIVIGQEDKTTAQAALSAYRQRCPDQRFAIAWLSGKLEAATGNDQQAIDAFAEALSYQPDDLPTVRLLISIADKSSQYQARWSKKLQSLLAQFPENETLLVEQARLLQKQGEWELAVQIMKKLVALRVTEPSYKKSLAQLYCQEKQYGPALQLYREIILGNPKDTDAYLRLAAIYSDLQLTKEAITVLQNGLAIDPQNRQLTTALKEAQNKP